MYVTSVVLYFTETKLGLVEEGLRKKNPVVMSHDLTQLTISETP